MPRSQRRHRSRPALCIVNYNGAVYLPSTLGRVRELRDQFAEIVFVDDASTDESVDLVRNLLQDAEVLVLPRNRGPAVARNAGLSLVASDRVLFMDNDVELESDAVDRLGRALDEHRGALLAMPRIVSSADPDHIEYEGGDAHFSGLMRLRGAGASASTRSAELMSVGSLVSCCFLFDRIAWAGRPLFDEGFDMYFEDHELGLRARMLGYDLLAVPGAVGLHGRGTPGISLRETGSYSHRRIVGTILHRWRLILKLYQVRTLILLSPYLLLFEAFQLAGAIALGWGRPWLAALGELMSSSGEIRRSRAAFQKLRRRSDRAVLSGGRHPFNPSLGARAVVRLAGRALDAIAELNWAVAKAFLPDHMAA